MIKKRKSWSPYKNKVIAFVKANPGCCKFAVAKHVTYSHFRCPSNQYYIVNTAIRNGWIKAQKQGNRYSLTVGD